MSSPKGFPSQTKDIRVGAQFATVEPVGQSQYGMSVLAHSFHFVVGTDAVEANTNADNNRYRIKATAHAALKGDIIRFTSGAFSGLEIRVHSVYDADNFDLVESLSAAPAAADAFQILRNKAPVINSDGTLFTASAGNISFVLDGASQVVTEDTITPANNAPLPVKLTSVTGDINITAGDLNVQTSHAGVNYDSVRIGDGTDLLAVNADGSLNVNISGEAATAADGAAAPAVAKVIGGVDGSGNTQFISVDTAGELQADIKSIEGIIDAGNSTTTPLAGGASFVGTWRDVKDYNSINLGVFSDQASATDGLRIEYSSDGVTVHHYHLWTFPGGANGIGYQLAVEFRYFRVNYTNGATPQTTFVIQSNLKPTALFPSSYRASTTFTANSQVILTKGIIVGETTGGGGGYVAVKVNPSGALTTETSISGSLPAGTNNIGDVDVLSLPSLPAGTNNIGNVDVVSLPSLPAGTNNIGDVDVLTLPSLPAGTNNIGDVDVLSQPARSHTTDSISIGDGTDLLAVNADGSINVAVTAALPSGTNNIGDVDVLSLPGSLQGYAEDSAHSSGHIGLMPLAVRRDTAASFADTDGDYAPLQVNSTGNLRVSTPYTAATGASIPTNVGVVGGSDGSLVRAIKTDSAGELQVDVLTVPSLSVVDVFDGPLLDASSVNIPGSASNSLQVIASLAANVKKIQILDTTGEFIGVYSGAVSSPTLMFIVGPGSDQTIEHSISAGTLISVRSLTTSAITSGNLAMNFMG